MPGPLPGTQESDGHGQWPPRQSESLPVHGAGRGRGPPAGAWTRLGAGPGNLNHHDVSDHCPEPRRHAGAGSARQAPAAQALSGCPDRGLTAGLARGRPGGPLSLNRRRGTRRGWPAVPTRGLRLSG
jgi:hypothetical protein